MAFFTSGAAAKRVSPNNEGESSVSSFDIDDGFVDPAPWLDGNDVEVISVTEPTRGALANAIDRSGPRVVIFETSGVIDLGTESLTIDDDTC